MGVQSPAIDRVGPTRSGSLAIPCFVFRPLRNYAMLAIALSVNVHLSPKFIGRLGRCCAATSRVSHETGTCHWSQIHAAIPHNRISCGWRHLIGGALIACGEMLPGRDFVLYSARPSSIVACTILITTEKKQLNIESSLTWPKMRP